MSSRQLLSRRRSSPYSSNGVAEVEEDLSSVASQSKQPPSLSTRREPSPPSHVLDLKKLPTLISENIYWKRLLPWSDPELCVSEVELQGEEVTPPWSLSLESYYKGFHPYTWIHLGVEYKQHMDYLLSLKAWQEERRVLGATVKELGDLEQKILAGHAVVWRIFASIYGLHYLRERYLDHYRAEAPGWTDAKIIDKTLNFERSGTGFFDVPYFCVFADQSIWPVPLPLSCILTEPSPTSKPIIALAEQSKAVRDSYAIPRFDSNYHLTFRPMPPSKLRQAYDEAVSKGAAPPRDVAKRPSPSYTDEELLAAIKAVETKASSSASAGARLRKVLGLGGAKGLGEEHGPVFLR
ncbi:hypothetical protein JCM11251_000949 [Rhodosporidiobolus azoricus]